MQVGMAELTETGREKLT